MSFLQCSFKISICFQLKHEISGDTNMIIKYNGLPILCRSLLTTYTLVMEWSLISQNTATSVLFLCSTSLWNTTWKYIKTDNYWRPTHSYTVVTKLSTWCRNICSIFLYLEVAFLLAMSLVTDWISNSLSKIFAWQSFSWFGLPNKVVFGQDSVLKLCTCTRYWDYFLLNFFV